MSIENQITDIARDVVRSEFDARLSNIETQLQAVLHHCGLEQMTEVVEIRSESRATAIWKSGLRANLKPVAAALCDGAENELITTKELSLLVGRSERRVVSALYELVAWGVVYHDRNRDGWRLHEDFKQKLPQRQRRVSTPRGRWAQHLEKQ